MTHVSSRLLKGSVSVAWLLTSGVLSVVWAIDYYNFSVEESAVGDFLRFGPLSLSLNTFAHWGWIFVLSLLGWAFRSGENLHRSRRQKQLTAASVTSGSLGHAGFASTGDLLQAELIGPKSKFGAGIRLGFDKESGKVLRYRGEAHGIIVAPARSGKFRDVIAALTLEWKHSMVIVDPKGQIAAVTKKQREKVGRVFVLNPFNVWPEYLGPSACYNPMSALNPHSNEFDAECDALADAIVVHEGAGDSHWSDSARLLVGGGIMASGLQMGAAGRADPGKSARHHLHIKADQLLQVRDSDRRRIHSAKTLGFRRSRRGQQRRAALDRQ
jgi:type IV secretory pathway TraG/TraD family ATPase VirD4